MKNKIESPRTSGRSLLRRLLIGRDYRKTLLRALILAVLCVLVFRFWLRPALVSGASMEPTIPDRGLHLINLLAYAGPAEPERGDIVAIEGAGVRVMYLKRVLALPGERVAFRQGDLFVNGDRIPETYVPSGGNWTIDEITLDGDEYFVAGDNRNTSATDHVMGVVSRRHIRGRLLFAGGIRPVTRERNSN